MAELRFLHKGRVMPFDGVDPKAPTPLRNIVRGAKTLFRETVLLLTALPTSPARSFEPNLQPDLRILLFAKGLLAQKKDWVQKAYKTKDMRRCAVGALRAAHAMLLLPQKRHPYASIILLGVATSKGFEKIEGLNDNTSHEQVLGAFDEAISIARARPYSIET